MPAEQRAAGANMPKQAGSSARANLDETSIATLTAITRGLTLAQIDRIVIEDRLALEGYRRAAQSLGISQATIYNKRRKWVEAERAGNG